MTRQFGSAKTRVLLIPGGASTVHGYFPDLSTALANRATIIGCDPPGIGTTSDRRPLRLSAHAGALAQTVERGGNDPVVVVAHSLGALVALRLAVDEADLVAALLLLDPTPLAPSFTLRVTARFLAALASLGPLGQRIWTAQARRDLDGVVMSASQEQAFAVYTDSQFLVETARWAKHLANDGISLTRDIAAGKLRRVPTLVVSAGERSPKSATRRAHEKLVEAIPAAQLQIWDGTTHPLHIQQPAKVADAILTLLALPAV